MYLMTDIIATLFILAAFILAVSVTDKTDKNTQNNKDKITENDLILLSKCNEIFWGSLSLNPFAVDLLWKRFEYEKSLSDAEYKKIPFNHKIDWYRISGNENAIELIKERIKYEESLGCEYVYQELPNHNRVTLNKINWQYMTTNQNAIELLRERIKYEKTLPLEKYNKLNNKIDWINNLGGLNRNAVILLKDLLIE